MSTIADLTDLRQRVLAGQELTVEEYRLVLDAKRAQRRLAAETAAKKSSTGRKKSPAKVMNLEELDALLNKL